MYSGGIRVRSGSGCGWRTVAGSVFPVILTAEAQPEVGEADLGQLGQMRSTVTPAFSAALGDQLLDP